MGWTGGYVLLALMLAPYLRDFGKFTVPDFVGDRYYSPRLARIGGSDVCAFSCVVHLRWQVRCVASAWCSRVFWQCRN